VPKEWIGVDTLMREKKIINNNIKQYKTKVLIEKLEKLIKIKQKD
jgi:hypothetical protein